ncbi:hypothetical protein ACKKBF_B31295 [Auxenochlorella protothecoides x Auxenochlorella symbiontica]
MTGMEEARRRAQLRNKAMLEQLEIGASVRRLSQERQARDEAKAAHLGLDQMQGGPRRRSSRIKAGTTEGRAALADVSDQEEEEAGRDISEPEEYDPLREEAVPSPSTSTASERAAQVEDSEEVHASCSAARSSDIAQGVPDEDEDDADLQLALEMSLAVKEAAESHSAQGDGAPDRREETQSCEAAAPFPESHGPTGAHTLAPDAQPAKPSAASKKQKRRKGLPALDPSPGELEACFALLAGAGKGTVDIHGLILAAATLGQEISVTEAETMLSFAHEESGRAESARHLTLAQFVGLAARLADAQAHR